MPTLTIGDKSVSVGDEFLKLSPEQQNATVEEISKSIGAGAKAEPVTANQVARSAATGVPLIGGALNQLDAATNAALAPVLNPLFAEKNQLKGATFAERRAESLRQQNAMDEKFGAEHPVIDTAAKITGGVAGTIPALMAAPAAFGLTGTLPQMVARGAVSNAALGGADALVRGEDPTTPALAGGVVGATAPLAGRAVGKLMQAYRDFRSPPPVVAQNVEKVAGVDIPLTSGQATADPAVQAEEEILRRGARGASAEDVARQADQQAQAAVAEASGNITKSLDPTGASPRTAPQAAGQVVQSELAQQEAARAAAATAQASQVGAEGESLARGLGGGAAPVSPFDAADSTGAAVAARRAASIERTKQAYKARDAVPGEFDPSVPKGLAEDIRGRLNTGDNPLWVDPTNESTANKALKLIDETVGKGLFNNAAAPRASAEDLARQTAAKELADTMTAQGIHPDKALKSAADAHGIAPEMVGAAEKPPVVDLKTMDEARKRLVTMFGDAKSASIRSGDKSDMRAMGKILHEFDNAIGDALESGKFSGDAKMAKELQDAARKSHAEYRQTFSSRGPGDEVGRAVEKILGRYSDGAATPDEIAQLAYGSRSEPGGGKAVKVALRLKSILGENSPEWGVFKRGLFAHVTETAPGEAAHTPAQVADRIDRFLSGSKGNGLAKVVLDSNERSQLAAHAKRLRGIEPKGAPANDLEKAVARIAGTDGHLPASPGEVTDMLYSRTGKGDKGISQRLAVHLKQNLTPESWTAVRQGMWEKLTNAGEGKIPFEAQALSQRLHEFLNESGKGLASILFTKAEREEMAKLAAVYRRMTPIKGTTNPSGSATIGAKIAHKAMNNLGAMLGFGAHGVTGALVGHGVQRAAGMVKDAKAAKEATRLFFGPQAKRAAATSRIPALIAPSAVAASQR